MKPGEILEKVPVTERIIFGKITRDNYSFQRSKCSAATQYLDHPKYL